MAVGALFLSLNVAPTDEVALIAYRMDPWRELGLLAVSLGLMHGFVYSFGFRGAEAGRPGEGFWSLLLRYTVVGYVLVLGVSLYVLWSFGRTEGHSFEDVLGATIVLGFPGAIGAAAARLIL
jgi:putative integral membrane protein (TIGR02587 family)